MKKDTGLIERMEEIFQFLNISKNEFAKNLNYNRSQSIYDIANGKAKPSFIFFEKLLNSEYSELIDIEYLITGRGEIDKRKKHYLPEDQIVSNSVSFLEETKNIKNDTLLNNKEKEEKKIENIIDSKILEKLSPLISKLNKYVETTDLLEGMVGKMYLERESLLKSKIKQGKNEGESEGGY